MTIIGATHLTSTDTTSTNDPNPLPYNMTIKCGVFKLRLLPQVNRVTRTNPTTNTDAKSTRTNSTQLETRTDGSQLATLQRGSRPIN